MSTHEFEPHRRHFKTLCYSPSGLKSPTCHPEQFSSSDFNSIKTLKDFDDVYTSKAHGFKNALDYYEKSSCLQFLPNIKIRTLIINALDDSFLSPECYPIKEAKNNPNLYLEMPKHGGHVGFKMPKGNYYNEQRALEFVVNENT